MTEVDEMYNSCEYEFSEEELAQLEEIYEQYDAMLKKEEEQNPVQIGFCGFGCNFGCPTCVNSGYDDSDEL
jgi:hypothetical protein